MTKIVFLSVIGIGVAIVFGYVGAAALATTLGQIVLAGLAGLIAISGVVEGGHMISHSRQV
jgi:hypothetical protein